MVVVVLVVVVMLVVLSVYHAVVAHLSPGVNLPARRVIIRTPIFHGKLVDPLVYKQMAGRAGRKGVDSRGESVLLCKPSERHKAAGLLNSRLRAVRSCLAGEWRQELRGNAYLTSLPLVSGSTYLTSLPLVGVRHHGRLTSVKVDIHFTSSASSTFLVHNFCCEKCI